MNKDLLRIAFKPLTTINKLVKKQNIIFIYSNLGFRDNVKTFYDYLVKHKYNEKYKIVVSLNDYRNYIEDAPDKVLFVNNKQGIGYFMKSKYAFYCFGKYPIKPAQSQTVVNLWHGMPLKRVGNMEAGLENVDYNFFTKIISTAELFNPILMKSFNCTAGQVDIMGQPRNDEMFIEDREQDDRVRKGADKVIVWLPTYREEAQDVPIPGLDVADVHAMNDLLSNFNSRLIIKIHPWQQFSKDLQELSNIEFMTQEMLNREHISVYGLLRASDALISDYSSVFFDYMLLNRPIAFMIEDIKRYQRERGFSFEDPLALMPGKHIRDVHGVLEFIKDVQDGRDEFRQERQEVNHLVNFYQDGNSSKRIAEAYIK